MEHVSTSVVIKGDAMIAGSRRTFFASSGSTHPISLEMMTVPISESPITRARGYIFVHDQNADPVCQGKYHAYDQRYTEFLENDPEDIFKLDLPEGNPADDQSGALEPQFPPVSISMGMKDTSRGIAAKASSYFVMIVPVMVAENIRIRSHTIRCLA